MIESDDWPSWHWQMAHRINTVEELSRYVRLNLREITGIVEASRAFRWNITPYYASLMDPNDPDCPIRKQAIPDARELEDCEGEMDPLAEEKKSPTKGLIHCYPDRVAFCVATECAMYCRHCVRKRIVGGPQESVSAEDIEAGLDYIRRTPQIRDVLITGGDPLTYGDDFIDRLLTSIRAIEHVEIIRIGTRVICTMPQRITPELCEIIAKHHPVFINTQFNHPKELTEQAAAACDRLLRAGVPLGNQSVLLKGINDDPDVQLRLVRGLLKMRVRPYYLYQCEVLKGTAHFRTSLEAGLNIIDHLQGWTSGLAVPRFVIDSPIGKIPLAQNTIVKRDEDTVTLRNYEGKLCTMINHRTTPGEASVSTVIPAAASM